MGNLDAIELKPYVPARDFELSKQFYQDLGFELCWSNDDMAHLHYGAEPPEDRPWNMRDLVLVDPSGVLWRIAQGAE